MFHLWDRQHMSLKKLSLSQSAHKRNPFSMQSMPFTRNPSGPLWGPPSSLIWVEPKINDAKSSFSKGQNQSVRVLSAHWRPRLPGPCPRCSRALLGPTSLRCTAECELLEARGRAWVPWGPHSLGTWHRAHSSQVSHRPVLPDQLPSSPCQDRTRPCPASSLSPLGPCSSPVPWGSGSRP